MDEPGGEQVTNNVFAIDEPVTVERGDHALAVMRYRRLHVLHHLSLGWPFVRAGLLRVARRGSFRRSRNVSPLGKREPRRMGLLHMRARNTDRVKDFLFVGFKFGSWRWRA